MTELRSLAQELLARQSAIDNLADFRTYMADSEHADFVHPPAAHHELIVEALQGLYERKYRKLLIMAPPGSAKSTYSSIQFITWYMAKHPDHSILTCSNTTDLAERFNKRRRSAVMTPEWETLSGTAIDPAAKAAADFHLLPGGSCRAAGIGSSITGLRSDLSIIDDPVIGFEQSLSPEVLDKMWNWYISDYRTRAKPDTLELLIMTRWARKDLAGRILDLISEGREEGWRVIRLPLEADADNPADDPLGRNKGELLWPEWYESRVEEFRRDPISWECLHQQRPIDYKGSWVPAKHIHTARYLDAQKESYRWMFAVDLALTDGAGDYSVIMAAGLDRNRNIMIGDVWRQRVNTSEVAFALIRLYQEYSPTQVLIDNDAGSKVFERLLYELSREAGQPVPLTMVPTKGRAKEIRASAVRGLFFHNRIHIAKDKPWTSELLREISEFPSADHDDQIDCLSLIGQHMVKLSPIAPNQKPVTNESALRDEVIKVGDKFYLPECYTLDSLFKDNEKPKRQFAKLRIDGR